jgi:SAM-dependent methyltransferase
VLEIASGTGQHIAHFASALPGIRWQPTEPDAASLDDLLVRLREANLSNIDPPLALDVNDPHWPLDASFDAIVCINMIHISPWSSTPALFAGGARHLRPGGVLLTYGPYLQNGTAVQSNLDFDASLKRRNPRWGLRDLDVVTRVAADHGFIRDQVIPMPANNLSVIFSTAA